MPLYEYACTKCGRINEVRHGFDETYAEPCPACGAAQRRVFNPAPVVFKGSGFYVTDSRKSSGARKSEKAKVESSPSPDSAAPAEKKGTKPSEPAA
ncbi:MAG: FmdB family zinc ribbon protein [Candidatus Baltobacteraceae bacterium]